MRIIVVKIGGALIAENFHNVVKDIADIYLNPKKTYKLVVLHGGGPQIDSTLHKMNKEPKHFKTPSGYRTRYTDQETVEVAIMALAGINNKRIVEALQKKGVNAFGFTGIDGASINAKRKEKILVLINGKRIMKRGEYSGKVKTVNTEIIHYLIEKNYIPVIGSLAKSEEGDIVNVDGDRAAGCVASALNAEILISLTDVEGIYKNFEDKDSLIKELKAGQLENILEELKGGMKKKAYAALEALRINVKKVIISTGLSERPITDALDNQAGTVILHD
ncbi:MAG: Acetylglutamate kinase [Promethearchaeota archaeon]|nr:MAG: Acetylglutamate kinase [Candidatus Lokiarchaeota archaeon]